MRRLRSRPWPPSTQRSTPLSDSGKISPCDEDWNSVFVLRSSSVSLTFCFYLSAFVICRATEFSAYLLPLVNYYWEKHWCRRENFLFLLSAWIIRGVMDVFCRCRSMFSELYEGSRCASLIWRSKEFDRFPHFLIFHQIRDDRTGLFWIPLFVFQIDSTLIGLI